MRIKSFLKTTIFYGVSTAINRGLMLIALPLLDAILTIEEYGLWTLSQILISLGAPVISMNSAAGILREGVENKEVGYSSFIKYTKLISLISLFLLIGLVFLPRTWLLYTLILVLIESFQNTLLGWYRARDRHINYFVLVLLKLLALIGAVVWVGPSPDLERLLFYQVVLGAIFILPFYLRELFLSPIKAVPFVFKNVLMFSSVLIPHGIAQWALSGSDRIVIKYVLDDLELGKYSLAYTLAMVLLMVNSGLALTIPNFILKNYQEWILYNKRVKILLLYSVAAIAINFTVVLSLDYLKPFISLLNGVDADIKGLMVWLTGGMYLLGIYLFYVNIVFYHRKSKAISLITLITASLNLTGTYILVKQMGIYGAAITTFASYLIYAALFIIQACKLESEMYRYLKVELSIILLATALNFTAFYFI
jgi:O-antigen/teichoic acid export membrane protein